MPKGGQNENNTLRWPSRAGVYLIVFGVLIVGPVSEQAAVLYVGQTTTIYAGYSPRGGIDTYTCAVARHLGKHIPGNPMFIAKNMLEAGGSVTANYL
ncbi:MAG: hypothetical protein ACE5HC_14270 [Candidatus Binatia bacterium]